MGRVFSAFNIIDIVLGVEGCPIHWLISSIPGFYPLGGSCNPHLTMPVKVSPDTVTHLLGMRSSLAENQWRVIIQVRDDGDLSHGSGRGSGNKWSDSGSIWMVRPAGLASKVTLERK